MTGGVDIVVTIALVGVLLVLIWRRGPSKPSDS